jgi:pilus assembly protein CpaE
MSDQVGMTIAHQNRIRRPALGTILVRLDVDQHILTDALRSGVREVVELGDLTGLAEAVHRAHGVARAMFDNVEHAIAAPPQHRGSLVTVFSTKGGVGKSLVATNLAASLADIGKRVCIVDLDVHCGDVAIMLQVTPMHTIADLTHLSGAIDASGVESLLLEHSPNLSILAAPVQLGTPVQADAVEPLLEVLTSLFDIVVVDTSGSFDDLALPAIDRSDLLVLVGTLDIPALKSLKLATGTLDLLNSPRSRWRLVLNRADDRVGLSTKEFVETLGVDVAASLPSSRDVLAAVNRGETIVRANAGHTVSKTLASFAAAVARDLESTPTDPEDGSRETAPKRRGPARRGLRLKRVG